MAKVSVMYWQEVPSLVEATDENGTKKIQLSQKYQVLIDHVAMLRKLDGSDDYLMQWTKEPYGEVDGSAEEAAAAVAAEFEDKYQDIKRESVNASGGDGDAEIVE